MGSSVGLDLSRLPGPSMSGQALWEMEGLVGRAYLKLSIRVDIFVTCAQRKDLLLGAFMGLVTGWWG